MKESIAFYEWAAGFDAIADVDEAVAKGLADLEVNDRARAILFYPLRRVMRDLRRDYVRRGPVGERRAPLKFVFAKGEPDDSPEIEMSLAEVRRRRLEHTFVVIGEDGQPSGERVSWGEATEEQHTLYMNYLRRSITGIEETIAEHREAIRLIRVHGVKCLNEIKVSA